MTRMTTVMPLSERVRIWATAWLQGAARVCMRLGLSPNALTLFAFAVVAGVGGVIAAGHFRLAGVLLLLTAWLDAVDGTLARMSGRVTAFGAFLDATLDRYAEAFLYLGLLVYYLRRDVDYPVLLVYLTIVGSMLISYTRAKAESVGIPVREGLLTRFERLAILVLGLLFTRVELALWLLAPLTHLTALQRMLVVWERSRAK